MFHSTLYLSPLTVPRDQWASRPATWFKGKLPNTCMGNVWLMRDAFVRARNYGAKRDAAAEKGEPFDRDLGLEALLSVLDGTMPFRVHCHRLDDIQTAVRISEEFSLRYTIEHCTEGRLIAP